MNVESTKNRLHTSDFEQPPTTEPIEDGAKTDTGKIRLGLVPTGLVWASGRAMTDGANNPNYGPYNWEKGLACDRLWDALMRHLQAFRDGEALDPKSGLLHTDHAAASLGMFIDTMRARQDLWSPWMTKMLNALTFDPRGGIEK